MFKYLFIFIFVGHAYAQEYELRDFSNSRPRGVQELLLETGLSIEQLRPFKCSNESRNKLFHTTGLSNINSDSIIIIGDNEKNYFYKNSSLYNANGKRVRFFIDSYTRQVLSALKKLSRTNSGAVLVRELQQSIYPVYIKKGGNRFQANYPSQRAAIHSNDAQMIYSLDELRPMVERMPFGQIGYGGIVYWNPNLKAKFIEDDGVKREVDSAIVLGHELYHAYDAIRGLLDRRFVFSDVLEQEPVCEFRAVRLENQLRKELGLHYRKYYSNDPYDTSKSMLDKTGKPIIIPAPCVHWLER